MNLPQDVSSILSADLKCDVCDALACIQYSEPTSQRLHTYCNEHRLVENVQRKAAKWVIRRRRFLPFENGLSPKMRLPRDSEEHKDLYWDMCEGQLIGGEGAVRYYFSAITGQDQFVAWEDQYVKDVADFVISRTSEGARRFIDNEVSPHWISCLAGFFRRECEHHFGLQSNTSKRLRAVELLLLHPDWTDEQIAREVPTTIQQLRKNTDYTGLRAVPIRRANAERNSGR